MDLTLLSMWAAINGFNVKNKNLHHTPAFIRMISLDGEIQYHCTIGEAFTSNGLVLIASEKRWG